MSKQMVHAIASYNAFICGEAYSLQQGWVEGALSTVDACLGDRLSIKSAFPPASMSIGLRRL
jgi:hypothetical protein